MFWCGDNALDQRVRRRRQQLPESDIDETLTPASNPVKATLSSRSVDTEQGVRRFQHLLTPEFHYRRCYAPHVAITELNVYRLQLPLHTPFVTALRGITHLNTLVVEIVDDDGCRGFGEASQTWGVTGESVAAAEACVQTQFRPLIMGRDPENIVEIGNSVRKALPGNFAAKAAIDVALHDLVARRRGVTMVQMLGGTRLTVPTGVTVSSGDAEEVARAARQRVDEGFTVLKVKVGTDARGDVSRVRAVRDAVGPGPRIRLDANQGWTPREAIRVIAAIEDADLDVEYVEQPVPSWDLDGLAWVTSRVDLPVMADESVFHVRDLVEVIKRRAADLVNVKIAKSGGLRPAQLLVDLARSHGMGVLVSSMMETTIGVGAAASLLAACDDGIGDLDAAWWLASSPVKGGPRYEEAQLVLSPMPGLGVDSLA